VFEVPEIGARWWDYCGLWSMEPSAAAKLQEHIASLDLPAHIAAHAAGLPAPLAAEKVDLPGGRKIAVVKLSGILLKSQSSFGGTSTVQARREIRAAAADPNVDGILLQIDSPGGTVAGTDDLAKEVKAANKQKPVWAHIEDLGASAAYWVASQASRITANSPTALVGSIGTIQVVHDVSQNFQREGIRTLVFATGPLKGLGTPGAPITTEQSDHLQSLIDSVQKSFDAAVRQGRGLAAKELAAVRHGGVLTAEDALAAKLVDGIQPLTQTITDFGKALKSKITFSQENREIVKMTAFETWVLSQGFDPEELSPEQTKSLQSLFQVSTNPANPPAPAAERNTFQEKLAAIDRENQRVAYIREATVAGMGRNMGDIEKCRQLRELCETACADPKTSERDFDLALLRQERSLGIGFVSSRPAEVDNEVLEAAVAQAIRLPNLEKKYPERHLEMASKRFKHGIALQELLALAAERNNGYRGSCRDVVALCRAAFGGQQYDIRADSGLSTISVNGILSNVANKSLASAFLYTEQVWRQISRIRTANDFKTMNTYRLTGSNKFEKVPAGGEIKHGDLGQLAYTNKVDTYGKMLGIDRRDIVNDDLGALAGATADLGRGAGDSLNEVFWTAWLDDSTFFPTDKSKNNYDDGATDSVLSLAGLENADTIFRQQTKPDGTPLGAVPAILLVPVGLRITALQLMNSTLLIGQGASAAALGASNPWAGAFTVAASTYLSNSSFTGYSATAWYLLADPNNIPAIEVAFLNGQESPTVETAEFDFDRLGLSMRAYMDFGVSKMEYRAGVKLKGAA
jgi:signal peptide peptidase SppA